MPFPITGQYTRVNGSVEGLVDRRIPALILELRKLDAEVILDKVGPVALDIIQVWRLSKEALGCPEIRESTAAYYRKVALTLEGKFGRWRRFEDGPMSPVQILQHLFEHTRKLEKASWDAYRSALLFSNHEHVTSFERRDAPLSDYYSYRRALAALIVIQRPPHRKVLEVLKPRRTSTGISRLRYAKLVTVLASTPGKKAHDFAVAAMVTGLRPSEWANATLRPAEPDDMNIDDDPSQWSLLTVETSKRKGDFNRESRSLLLRHDVDHSIIIAHMKNFAAAVAKTRTKGGRELASSGGDLFIKQTSAVIKQACKRLWPSNPEYWATLYNLRKHTRANFAKRYGTEVAAAMLGHASKVGQTFYSPKRYGSTGSHRSEVRPGEDVLQRAATMPPTRPRPEFTMRDDDLDDVTEKPSN